MTCREIIGADIGAGRTVLSLAFQAHPCRAGRRPSQAHPAGRKNRSALRRSVAVSRVAGPPRLSQALSTQRRKRHPALQRAGLLKHVMQNAPPCAGRPRSARQGRCSSCRQFQMVSFLEFALSVSRSASFSPHQGARNRASQAHAVSRMMQGPGQRQQVLDNGAGPPGVQSRPPEKGLRAVSARL